MSNVDPNKSPDAFLADIEKGAAESRNYYSSGALNAMLPPFAGLVVRLSREAAETARTNAKTADKTLTFTRWLLWITIVLLLVTGFLAGLEFMKFYESHYRHPDPDQTQQHNAGEISSLPAPTAGQQQLLAQTPKIEQPKGEAERREQAATPDKRGTDEVPLSVKILPAPDAETKAAEEKRERDKKASTDNLLVKWTHALFWATVALALVAAVQIGLFWYQLRLMRRAVGDAAMAARAAQESADAAKDGVELARKTFTADQRPWVSVVISVISPVTYDQAGSAHITFRFTLRNVGRSPATNVDVFPMIYPFSNKRLLARLEQKKIAAIGRIQPPPEEGFFGDVLFPGPEQSLNVDLPLTVNRVEIDAAIAELGAECQYFMPVLVGCVGYSFTFANERHQTGFIAHVSKINASDESGLAIGLGKEIPAENMRLLHIHGAYVD